MKFTSLWVPWGLPVGRKAQPRRDFGVSGLDNVDDALFFEALVGVFEGFFVNSFKVGEVALVVERLA